MSDSEQLGWDGPNIRPPQVRSSFGSRSANDRHRDTHRSYRSDSSSHRSSRNDLRRDDSRRQRPDSDRRGHSERLPIRRRRLSEARNYRNRHSDDHMRRRRDRRDDNRQKRERSRTRETTRPSKQLKAEDPKMRDKSDVENDESKERTTRQSDEASRNENETDLDDAESRSSSNSSSAEGEESSSSSSPEGETGSDRSETTPASEDGQLNDSEDTADDHEQREASPRSEPQSKSDETPTKSPTPRKDWTENEDDYLIASTREQSPASPEFEEENRVEEEVEEKPEDAFDKLPPYLPSVYGCRGIEEFDIQNKVEEGTFGIVYRAIEKRTNEYVALKKLKMEHEKEGFPITSLREINTLLIAQHRNVVTVREIVCSDASIYIVMDFVEHDLKSLMETMRQKGQIFLPGEVKCLMIQLCQAIAHLHDNWILHRDIKSSNILLSHDGILKVGDFGLAREYGSPLKRYTSVVVTLWYRSPELILGSKEYSTYVDDWSVGCIFGELLTMKPIFPGKSEQDQICKIFSLLGSPDEKTWPGVNKLPVVERTGGVPYYPPSNLRKTFLRGTVSDCGLNLLRKFLAFNPKNRISCKEALKDEYFDEDPLPIDPSMFPTWPAKSEMSAKGKRVYFPKAPSGGGAFKKLHEDDTQQGFVVRPGKPQPPPWSLQF